MITLLIYNSQLFERSSHQYVITIITAVGIVKKSKVKHQRSKVKYLIKQIITI